MRLVPFSDDLPSAAPRIYPVDVSRLEVAGYDIDNGYPQRMETLINASSTAKQSVEKLKEYITGQGFDKDQNFWNYVCNSYGLEGDELLELLAEDYAKYENFAVQLNYNALFDTVERNYIPFKNIRLGIGKKAGKVGIWTKWWTDNRFGRYVRNTDITWVDLFDPTPGAIKAQVSQAGGWKSYNGQVCLFNPNYTLSTVDSVLDDIEAEILSKKTSKSNIKNNFGDKIVWLQPEGERFAVDDTNPHSGYAHQDDYTEALQEWVGPDAPQLIAAFFKSDADKPEFLKIENRLDDKKFAYTIENARANIYRSFNQPAILHSDLTQGRYNQNQLPEAMKYYNNSTENKRIKMQRFFKKVFGMVPELAKTEFSIMPLNDLTSAVNNTEGANSNAAVNTAE